MTWRRTVTRAAGEVVGRGLPGGRRGLRSLLYHAVGTAVPDDSYGLSISADRFRQHLDALAAGRDDGRWRLGPFGPPPPDGLVVALTFDDGFADVLDVAGPLLVERGIPATVFVTSDFVGRANYLSPDGVRELADLPAVTVGAHGASHARLTRCRPEDLDRELRSSRAALEDILGRPVTTMAYPHGAVDGAVRQAVERAGYTLAGTSRFGVHRAGDDPLLVRRTEVVAADDVGVLGQKVRGGWDWNGLRPAAR